MPMQQKGSMSTPSHILCRRRSGPVDAQDQLCQLLSDPPGWQSVRSPSLRTAAVEVAGALRLPSSATPVHSPLGVSTTREVKSTSPKTPTPPPEASPAATLRRRYFRRRESLNVKCATDDVERCSCCTKDDVWSLFDAFEAMDCRGVDSISRADFFWALKALGAGVEFQKAVQKARVSAYFHQTAQDLSLEDFIRRALPIATECDVKLMLRWTDLKKVHSRLTSGRSEPTEGDMKQLYATLLEDGAELASVNDLARARLFTRTELSELPPLEHTTRLTFDEFCGVVFEKYLWAPDESPFDEAESCWSTGLREKFQAARVAQAALGGPRKSVERVLPSQLCGLDEHFPSTPTSGTTSPSVSEADAAATPSEVCGDGVRLDRATTRPPQRVRRSGAAEAAISWFRRGEI
mmetsp:Transcript_90499/g.255472  ORF Transcript_90499/g.255472 Transcript_90499/m.255472 type:complete len:407 (+) Transcript_90499:3-1223(+)